jgi:hypothetical protein
MNYQIVAEVATHTHTQKQTNIHALSGVEPAMPAVKQLETSVLDRSATVLGLVFLSSVRYSVLVFVMFGIVLPL